MAPSLATTAAGHSQTMHRQQEAGGQQRGNLSATGSAGARPADAVRRGVGVGLPPCAVPTAGAAAGQAPRGPAPGQHHHVQGRCMGQNHKQVANINFHVILPNIYYTLSTLYNILIFTLFSVHSVCHQVFLHHLTPLVSRPSFPALWLQLLELLRSMLQGGPHSSDLLHEATLESLKNMLLVMDSVKVTTNPPQKLNTNTKYSFVVNIELE